MQTHSAPGNGWPADRGIPPPGGKRRCSCPEPGTWRARLNNPVHPSGYSPTGSGPAGPAPRRRHNRQALHTGQWPARIPRHFSAARPAHSASSGPAARNPCSQRCSHRYPAPPSARSGCPSCGYPPRADNRFGTPYPLRHGNLQAQGTSLWPGCTRRIRSVHLPCSSCRPVCHGNIQPRRKRPETRPLRP